MNYTPPKRAAWVPLKNWTDRAGWTLFLKEDFLKHNNFNAWIGHYKRYDKIWGWLDCRVQGCWPRLWRYPRTKQETK